MCRIRSGLPELSPINATARPDTDLLDRCQLATNKHLKHLEQRCASTTQFQGIDLHALFGLLYIMTIGLCLV